MVRPSFFFIGILILAEVACSRQRVLLPGHRITVLNLQVQRYTMACKEGIGEAILVNQEGVNVGLILKDPEGAILFEMNGPSGALGAEKIFFIPTKTGTYSLEVVIHFYIDQGYFNLSRQTGPDFESQVKACQLLFSLPDHLENALPKLDQAKAYWQAVGDVEQEALVWWRQARMAGKEHQFDSMILAYQRVDTLLSQLKGKEGLFGMALHNLSLAQSRVGAMDEAFVQIQRALSFRSKKDYFRGESLAVLGRYGTFLGSYSLAEKALIEARSIFQDLRAFPMLARVFGELGWLYDARGQYKAAMDAYDAGLAVLGEGHQGEKFRILNFKMKTLNKNKAYQHAMATGELAVSLFPQRPELLAIIELSTAESLIALGAKGEAIHRLEAVQPYFPQNGDPVDAAHWGFLYAQALAPHDVEEALKAMDQVAEITECIEPETLSYEARRRYHAVRFLYKDLHLDLLINSSREDRSHGKAFNFVASNRGRFSFQPSQGSLNSRSLKFKRELQHRSMAAKFGSNFPTSETELNEMFLRFDEWVEPESRASTPDHHTVRLTDIEEMFTDDATLLLYFALGRKNAYLWTMYYGRTQFFNLGDRARLENLILDFYEILKSGPNEKPSRQNSIGKILCQTLLKPLMNFSPRRVVVISEGKLHFIPWSALPPPGGRFPEPAELEWIRIPASWTIGELNQRLRSGKGKGVAILANPDFSGQLSQLSFANKEALAIQARVPELKVQFWTGAEASLDLVLSGALMDFKLIHFATHGFFDDRRPGLSSLALASRNGPGYLSPSDVRRLSIKAQLVVLSACDSGMGELIRGEGLQGFVGAFMEAGAAGVMVTFWPVDDRATAIFMDHFYESLLEQGFAAPTALARAKKKMRSDSKYGHPFYWAGFTYHGGW